MKNELEHFINYILTKESKLLIKERFPEEKDMKIFLLTLYDISKNQYEDLDTNLDIINNTLVHTLSNISLKK